MFAKSSRKFSALLAAATLSALAAAAVVLAQSSPPTSPAANLNKAIYQSDGKLQYPTDAESWTVLGASIGGDYREGDFDPKRPRLAGRSADRAERTARCARRGRYADGTMLLLTFYQTAVEDRAAARGVRPGRRAPARDPRDRSSALQGRRSRVLRVSGLRLRRPPASRPSAAPASSVCNEHGQLDGTFRQFYPPIRQLTQAGAKAP